MSRSINQATIDLIKRFEGLHLTPYLCPAGVWTIGWGSTRDLSGSPISSTHTPISQETAESLLMRDCLRFSRSVESLVNVPLNDNQHGALVSFTYNFGPGRLQSSTLRTLVNRRDFEGAAEQFQRWVLARGVRLRGLVLRREAERQLFLRPVVELVVDNAKPAPTFWDRLAQSFRQQVAA